MFEKWKKADMFGVREDWHEFELDQSQWTNYLSAEEQSFAIIKQYNNQLHFEAQYFQI